MVPHDQQLAVPSPRVTREAFALDSRFAIDTPKSRPL
jgi:hypothetical protein